MGNISRLEGSGKDEEGFMNAPCCADPQRSKTPTVFFPCGFASLGPKQQSVDKVKPQAPPTGCSSTYTPSVSEGTGRWRRALASRRTGLHSGCAGAGETELENAQITSAGSAGMAGCSSTMSEGTGAPQLRKVRTSRLGHRGTPDCASGAQRHAAGCSSTSLESTAESRQLSMRTPDVYLRETPDGDLKTGDTISPVVETEFEDAQVTSAGCSSTMSEGTGSTRRTRVRMRGLDRGTPDGAVGAVRNAAGCSSSSLEGTAAPRKSRMRTPGVYLRGAPEVALETGESISPEGRAERTDRQGTVCYSHDSSSSIHAPSSYGGLLSHAQRCARHSGSRAAFVDAFELRTPHVVAAPAVSSFVHVRQSTIRAGWSTGILGVGEQRP